jgi:glycosyltransferase involved in cell wall biosynthesis
MKLSVIVPVYNMEEQGKLSFCLDSLVNQTISDYEILAVDDASTDGSLRILRDYEARYPGKIRVISLPVNRRQGGAKNEGLKAAEGEWVGFIDSDDWVAPDYYEKLLQKARETGADLVGCDYSLVTAHTMEPGKRVAVNAPDQTGRLDREKRGKLILRPGSMVVKIYRHSVIRENSLDFPEGIFYEDNCAGPVWSLYFTRFERVDEPLYYYYQHGVSTVHRISEASCRDRLRAGVLLYEEFRKRGFLERYFPELEYRFAELYYVNTLFSYFNGVRRPKFSFLEEMKRGIRERFPDFQKNPYYQAFTGEEEKRLIGLHGKSGRRFYWYFGWKRTVRNLRGAQRPSF